MTPACSWNEIVDKPRHTIYVLLAIAERPRTFNEIEERTHIPPSTLTRSLRILIQADMIKTRPLNKKEEETCRGLWKYVLTEKGKNLEMHAKIADHELRMFWMKIKNSTNQCRSGMG